MKQKKQSSNWYIAATHYLTAGFAIPFIINLIAGFTLLPLINKIELNVLTTLFNLILLALSVWFGVMYSAKYLKRTYIIQNREAIIKSSTTYMVVLMTAYFALPFFTGHVNLSNILSYSISAVIFLSVRAISFYAASKKYVSNDEIGSNASSATA